jgi:hypothetical protein
MYTAFLRRLDLFVFGARGHFLQQVAASLFSLMEFALIGACWLSHVEEKEVSPPTIAPINPNEAETNAESTSAFIPCTHVRGLPVYGGSSSVTSSGCIEIEE